MWPATRCGVFPSTLRSLILYLASVWGSMSSVSLWLRKESGNWTGPVPLHVTTGGCWSIRPPSVFNFAVLQRVLSVGLKARVQAPACQLLLRAPPRPAQGPSAPTLLHSHPAALTPLSHVGVAGIGGG